MGATPSFTYQARPSEALSWIFSDTAWVEDLREGSLLLIEEWSGGVGRKRCVSCVDLSIQM